LKAEDLYDKEKVDLETIVIDDVFKLLQCDENGLTEDEAVRRLELFGPNKLEVEEQNAILQVLFLSVVFRTCVCSLSISYRYLVPQFYVESPVMGHGSRCNCCYRPFQRWR